MRRSAGAAIALVAALAAVTPTFACTVCVGDPSSPLTWGVNRGIVFLLGAVVLVYGGVIAFVVAARRRRTTRTRLNSPSAVTATPDVRGS